MDPDLVLLIKDLGATGAVLWVMLFKVVPLLQQIAAGQGCRYGDPPPPPRQLGPAVPVLALLVLAFVPAFVIGCSSLDGVRRNAPELRRSWQLFRDASEPAPVVSRDAWVNLGDAVSANLEAVERASDE
jgi:hypothetical protein